NNRIKLRQIGTAELQRAAEILRRRGDDCAVEGKFGLAGAHVDAQLIGFVDLAQLRKAMPLPGDREWIAAKRSLAVEAQCRRCIRRRRRALQGDRDIAAKGRIAIANRSAIDGEVAKARERAASTEAPVRITGL